MAEPHDDEARASRAYRGLPREEPPARLDDAIRAAARREAASHPAPLVAPTGRRKWYVPLAAAAVIVLAVAVTSQVEREQADPMQAAAPPVKEEQAREVQAGGRQAEAKVQAAPPPERRPPARLESRRSREDFTRDRLARNEAPQAAASAAPAAQAPAAAPAEQAKPEEGVRAKTALMKQAATPEGELERIAELRREGKDEEADRALAEFRKRYPGYRIAPEVLRKVEKK